MSSVSPLSQTRNSYEAPLQTRPMSNLSQFTHKTSENVARNNQTGNILLSDGDLDPYAPSIAQDLLSASSSNEWRNI